MTDYIGQHHLLVSEQPSLSPDGPRWSPSGDRIAYITIGGAFVVDPISQSGDLLPNVYFTDWFSRDHLISLQGYPGPSNAYLIDVHTGAYSLWRTAAGSGFPPGGGELYKEPHILGGYVGAIADYYWAPTMDVFLLDDNLRVSSIIWKDPDNAWDDMRPIPDPTCRTVAWTRIKIPNGVSRPRTVALKDIAAPSTYPPTILAGSYRNAVFCNWVDADRLLVVTEDHEGKLSLVTMDKEGTILNTISTPNGLAYADTNAPSRADVRRRRHF